jgi:hypothetical protein
MASPVNPLIVSQDSAQPYLNALGNLSSAQVRFTQSGKSGLLLTDQNALLAVSTRDMMLGTVTGDVQGNASLSSLLSRLHDAGIVNNQTVDTGPPPPAGNVDYDLWVSRVNSGGGTYTANSKAIALALSNALIGKSYYSKIVYLLPLLGGNLAAAEVPLRDPNNFGVPTNTNFVDADFSESTGLRSNGSKSLTCGFTPDQLGSSHNGGMGYWEKDFNNGGYRIGMSTTTGGGRTFGINLDVATKVLQWGDGNTLATGGGSSMNNHYYGQRSNSANILIFQNGSQIGSNTSGVGLFDGIGDHNCLVFNVQGGTGPHTLCAVAYFTDGTMSSSEISDWHSLLQSALIGPTGR